MHDQLMTNAEFEAHLDRLGATIDRWPSELALDARRLLAQSADARARLKEASALDVLLDEALPAASLSTGAVRSRILDAVARDAAGPSWWAWLVGTGMRRPIAIVVALIPLCLGFAFGIYEPTTVSDDLASDVSLLAFADYEGIPDAN
ncbi:MAG TPA: hypothetical protein VMJ74_06585 [Pseudomonadales bacterium]|nr:hypothetical protein [Pseudomonadales bacterium]